MPSSRPPSISKARVNQIAEVLLYGFSDEEIAEMFGISSKTIQRMRAGRYCPAIKRAELSRKALYIRRITEGKRADWPRWAWFLERRFPLQFAKPEIQLSVINNAMTVNNTALVISAEEGKAIYHRVKETKAKVIELFKDRRPLPKNGEKDKPSFPEA